MHLTVYPKKEKPSINGGFFDTHYFKSQYQ